jgi:hypothetical protein
LGSTHGFADGTLVYLAKREFLSAILTVDHADFATYRIEGKRLTGPKSTRARHLIPLVASKSERAALGAALSLNQAD